MSLTVENPIGVEEISKKVPAESPAVLPSSLQHDAAPVVILGVPFDTITTAQTLALIERMIESRRPHYFATANVDFLVQSREDVELRRILLDADLVLCDGTPLVWASRLLGNPLPERVAGSDLVPLLVEVAARKGYRIFFLGGSEEACAQAVERITARHPQLQIAGCYSPPFSPVLEMDHDEARRRIEAAKPDLLFVSFGCPKQEKWIAMHYQTLGVPVSVGVGATIDFLAGRLSRAPLWMRRTGLEWIFRLAQEPRRLFRRYARDLWKFGLGISTQWWRMHGRPRTKSAAPAVEQIDRSSLFRIIPMPGCLDRSEVVRSQRLWEEAASAGGHCLAELSATRFMDSTGLGLLVRLRKQLQSRGCELVLVNAQPAIRSVLRDLGLESFFLMVENIREAKRQVSIRQQLAPAVLSANLSQPGPRLTWQGEVTAANAVPVWETTMHFLQTRMGDGAQLLTIDLSGLRFIDSTGVSIMIRSRKCALQMGARLVFIDPQENVRNVLRVSRLEQTLLGPA